MVDTKIISYPMVRFRARSKEVETLLAHVVPETSAADVEASCQARDDLGRWHSLRCRGVAVRSSEGALRWAGQVTHDACSADTEHAELVILDDSVDVRMSGDPDLGLDWDVYVRVLSVATDSGGEDLK